MKTIKALVVAGLMVASAVMAAKGPPLWKFAGLLGNDPYIAQVMTPGVLYCWLKAPEPGPDTDPPYYSPCYTQSGGWWFGYGDNGGKIYDGVDNNWDLTANQALKVEEYINGGHSFILNKGMGNATEGIHVKYVLTAGTEDEPSLSGIGFNWRAAGADKDPSKDYENKATEDFSGKAGLYIEYTASVEGITVELGWNEGSYGFNTWVYTLPACATFCTKEMPWSEFEQSYEGDTEPLGFAFMNGEALKISYKNKDPNPVSVEFKMREIGWLDGPNPVAKGNIVSGPKFSVSNRVLSIANVSAPTPVQVINMQGAIVAQKTLGPSESMNLANMPTGVYMVRSTKLGISQKIILK